MKRFDVEFTKDGSAHSPAQIDALLAGLGGATDLLVVSHGWNNDMAEARALYDELIANIDRLLTLGSQSGAPAALAKLQGRTFVAAQLFWPSKKFADADLIPGGGAASAVVANDAALERVLDELANDPIVLGQPSVVPVRRQLVAKLKTLATALETPGAQEEFVFTLRTLLDPAHASEDDCSDEFFTANPKTLFAKMEATVVAPSAASTGGATGLSGGGAAGLGDLLSGAKAAARRLANFATYYQMKGRAGTIGSTGVVTMLTRVRDAHSQLRLHLVGHSFGGRLVTAAAHGLADDTPSVTISLLQAAFSHNGLSGDFGQGHPGAFRAVVAKKRVSGPIVITHTKNDTAVGIAYPLASRLAGQNAASAAALGDANDPYGGMGRNGAQRTVEADGLATELSDVGHIYGFQPGKIYNLQADRFISNHGDIRGLQVAYAVLSAAGA